jgi:hypothetical protein
MFALNGAGAAGCDAKQNQGAPNRNEAQVKESPQVQTPATGEEKGVDVENGQLKVLAGGGYGQVEEPFLVVARDVKVYDELRALVDGLPEVDADYFKTNAVVAAFLGMRRTGGYSVEIKGAASGLLVSEQSPPKGAMTTQALTNPFKVVAVPVNDEGGIRLQLQGSWARVLASSYRVASGEFETSGGITGRGERFKLEGGLSVARREKLVTVLFDLKSAGAKKPLALSGAATGVSDMDGRFVIAPIDPGTLVGLPHSALRATGQFTGDGARLSLQFESLPAKHPESFAGRGSIEAEATTTRPAEK